MGDLGLCAPEPSLHTVVCGPFWLLALAQDYRKLYKSGMGGESKSKRSGSQKRKVTARIAINCTPTQKAAILAKAKDAGLSPTAICLAMLLDAPLPKRRNPAINNNAITHYLANTAKVADALTAQTKAMGKPGSNLNQVAYMLNANTAPERIINITESAIREFRELMETYRQAAEDLKELRVMGMNALGLER